MRESTHRLALWGPADHDLESAGDLPASELTKSSLWFDDLRQVLVQAVLADERLDAAQNRDRVVFARAGGLISADVIIPPIDTMAPHYPSFLAGCCMYEGGADAFMEERVRRMDLFWQHVQSLLPSLGPKQRLLLFDLESDHAPCSYDAHRRKWLLPEEDGRLVHVSICMAQVNYRAGRDISFPAVLPAALGLAEQRQQSLANRQLLFCFKGRCSHPVRQEIFKLHNGDDQICVDCGE